MGQRGGAIDGKDTKQQGIRSRRGSNRTRPRPDHMTTRADRGSIARQSQDDGQAIKSTHTINAIASVPSPTQSKRRTDRMTASSTRASPPRRSPRSPCRLGGANGGGTDGRIDSRADRSRSSHPRSQKPTDGDAPGIDGMGRRGKQARR